MMFSLSNLGDRTLALHPLSNRHHFIMNPLSHVHLRSRQAMRFPAMQKLIRSHKIFSSSDSAPSVMDVEDDKEFDRPALNHPPSFWRENFLDYTPIDEGTIIVMKEEVKRLKEKVNEELLAARSDRLQWLNYINSIELLGLAYHFDSEIKEGLQHIHEDIQGWQEDDLYHISLQFRLLRQHGYCVPCDVFKKFKDEKGCFMEPLTKDVKGMLALYEASHVRVHGEDILDEACAFTTAHLKSMAMQLSCPLLTQVTHALKQPLNRFYSRLYNWHYISVYESEDLHSKSLLKLAKLDFNLVQSLHKEELNDLISWWKGQCSATKLPFFRDTLVQFYFAYTATLFEPQYSALRRDLTKISAAMTLVDDLYDGCGTIQELELFTEAFERWDKNCIHQLPDYMQPIYKMQFDILNEMEETLAEDGRSDCVPHMRELIKASIRAYNQHAKWRLRKESPTYDEYWINAVPCVACSTVYSICLILLGKVATVEVFEWANQLPKALIAFYAIARLLNDLSKSSRERDGMLSSVPCYMKQFNVSEEQAIQDLRKKVDEFWKDLNQEMLQPTVMPPPIMNSILKLTRISEISYLDDDDIYSTDSQSFKENIAKLFGDPIPMYANAQ